MVLNNCISFSEPGKPSLPIYPIKILIPLNCDLSDLDISYGQMIKVDCDIKNKPIIPQQEPIKIGFNEKTTFRIDEDIYCSSKPIVNSLYSFEDISYCRGYKILSLSLHPGCAAIK